MAVILSQSPSCIQLLIPLITSFTCESNHKLFIRMNLMISISKWQIFAESPERFSFPQPHENICRALTCHFNFNEICFTWNEDFQSWSKAFWSSSHSHTGHYSWSGVYLDWYWCVQNRMALKERPTSCQNRVLLGSLFPLQAADSQRKGLRDDNHKASYLTADPSIHFQHQRIFIIEI